MIDRDAQRQLTRDLQEIFKRIDDLETFPVAVTGGAVPPAGTLYNHLEDDGVAWVSVTNLTFADDAWIGLGGAAARIEFDNQAPDEINLLDCSVGIGTSAPTSILNTYEDNIGTGSGIGLTIEQDGAGDAVLQWLITGITRWVSGIDNSDSDKWKLASSSDLNTDARLTVTTAGVVAFPAYGAGFVQSSAAGLLSTGAIAAGDLPAHTHAGAGEGGTVAHSVTTGQTTDDHHAEVHVVNSTGPHAEAGLTIGHVLRATGAAAFSFGALIASDLPVHTHSGAADGGSLVIGTTDTDATPGSLLFAGALGVTQQNNANLFWDDTNNVLGIRSNAPAAVAAGLYVTWVTLDALDTAYFGSSNAANNQRAITGESYSSSGVRGLSNSNVGVVGYSINDTGTWGVTDGTATDNGVLGTATAAGRGVYGLTVSGVGVQGDSATGVAGRFNLTGAGTEILLCEDNGTRALTVDDGGKVSVGNLAAPISPLHIYEDTTATGVTVGLTIEQDGTGDAVAQFLLTGGRRWVCGIDNSATDSFKFASTTGLASNARLTLGVNGFVGIGENSNANMTIGLTINQAANDDEILAAKSSDVTHGMTALTETDTYGTLRKAQATSGGVRLAGYKDANGADGLAVLILGNLGEAADVTKSTSANGVVEIRSTVKSGTGVTDVGADGNLLVVRNNATSRFIFDAEGTGHADVSWITFSDRRLKQNIEPLGYGLDEILALNPVSYNRKETGRAMVGLIAQDVDKWIPEATRKPPSVASFWSLDYNALVPVLVRAVQELKAEIEELKNGT